MRGTCKGAVWSGEKDIRVMDVKLPECKDDGMIIKVNAASICGTDLHVFKSKPSVPTILGHEVCGTIVEMGKNANKTIKCYTGALKIGDRINLYPWITCGTCKSCLRFGVGACGVCENSFVYGLPYECLGMSGKPVMSSSVEETPYIKGGFSEYMYILPGTYVWQVPEEMPASVASLLDPMAVAMRAIELAQRSPGMLEDVLNCNGTALVIGDGQIGALIAACLRKLGVNKILIAGGRDERLKVAQDISKADCTMNYHKQSLEERIEIVNAYTNGFGADVVFQCVGNAQAFREGIELMRSVGTMIEVGNIASVAPIQFDPARDLCSKHATYIGMSVNTPSAFNKAFHMLLSYKELGLEKLLTDRCTLDTLLDTMLNSNAPSYIKGWVDLGE